MGSPSGTQTRIPEDRRMPDEKLTGATVHRLSGRLLVGVGRIAGADSRALEQASAREIPDPVDPVAAPGHIGKQYGAPVTRGQRDRNRGSRADHLGPAG